MLHLDGQLLKGNKTLPTGLEKSPVQWEPALTELTNSPETAPAFLPESSFTYSVHLSWVSNLNYKDNWDTAS